MYTDGIGIMGDRTLKRAIIITIMFTLWFIFEIYIGVANSSLWLIVASSTMLACALNTYIAITCIIYRMNFHYILKGITDLFIILNYGWAIYGLVLIYNNYTENALWIVIIVAVCIRMINTFYVFFNKLIC